MNTINPETYLETLQALLSYAPDTIDTSTIKAAIDALNTNPDTEPVKIWFLLDRSGSMGSLAKDVIGGFNEFLTEQAAKPGEAHLTAVQFDTQNPFEIFVDNFPISEVPPLTSDVYQPRGGTPLYDAIGQLIQHADDRIQLRAGENQPLEDQLILVFTDGYENSSHTFDNEQVFEMIQTRKDKEDQNWTFVFMGANQDAYLAGGGMGIDDGNIQNYSSSSRGVSESFRSMSRATAEHREADRRGRRQSRDLFYGDRKEAEEEYRQQEELRRAYEERRRNEQS